MTNDYITVSKTKKEYVAVEKRGGWPLTEEWLKFPDSGIIPYLLGKSQEGKKVQHYISNPKYAGRWAGDEVWVVEAHAARDLYEKVKAEYTNIFRAVLSEYVLLV